MSYHRTSRHRLVDMSRGTDLEDQIRPHLGHVVDNTASTNRLDFWIPGSMVEVKGQYQPLSERWTQHWPGVRIPFVLDELSVRKAAEHFPYAHFIMATHDERLFVASISQILCGDRVRLNRKTERVFKGKWILDLAQYTELDDLSYLRELLLQDMVALPWKKSECLIEAPNV